MDHQQAHEQWADLVLGREAERDRGDDRNRAGATAPTGECGRNGEGVPRDRRDSAAHRAHRHLDQPVDRVVVLRERKQGSPNQGQEQPARKAGDDLLGGHAGHQRADQERAHEGEARPC